MSEENPKKKFICLHCGTVFESEKEAPQCPNCHRRKVMPFDLFVQSIEKNRDKLKELGVLPESEDKPVTPEVSADSGDVTGGADSDSNDTSTSAIGDTAINVTEPVNDSDTSTVTAEVPVTSEESTVTADVGRDNGTPESDELLMKYLRDLDDEPEVKPKSSPSRKKKRPRKVTVPVGRSLIEVLLFIGLAVLLYKWWTSRQSAPTPSGNVDQVGHPRYGSTYEMINRNIGHRTLG